MAGKFQPRKQKCEDCGQEYLRTGTRQVRCEECQHKRLVQQKAEFRAKHGRRKGKRQAKPTLTVKAAKPAGAPDILGQLSAVADSVAAMVREREAISILVADINAKMQTAAGKYDPRGLVQRARDLYLRLAAQARGMDGTKRHRLRIEKELDAENVLPAPPLKPEPEFAGEPASE